MVVLVLYAKKDCQKVRSTPGARAKCPACGNDVIAKCGSIKVWHWSHISADCDPWSEPETEWHLGWKEEFPEECREVVIGPHRADVCTSSGIVIEFQHSPISSSEITEREQFYGERMIWVVDASRFKENLESNFRQPDTVKWINPRKSWFYSTRPLFFDLGDGYLMYVKDLLLGEYYSAKYAARVTLIPRDFFLSKYRDNKKPNNQDKSYSRKSLASEMDKIKREQEEAREKNERMKKKRQEEEEERKRQRDNYLKELAEKNEKTAKENGFSSYDLYLNHLRMKRQAESLAEMDRILNRKPVETDPIYKAIDEAWSYRS